MTPTLGSVFAIFPKKICHILLLICQFKHIFCLSPQDQFLDSNSGWQIDIVYIMCSREISYTVLDYQIFVDSSQFFS